MKKIINRLLLACAVCCMVACWSDDIIDAGAPRRQVSDLRATPGDEEVSLAWSMPDGWNPTDYIVSYTDAEANAVTFRTGGAAECMVTKLVNDVQYTFNVQAVYGKLISNMVSVAVKPATTRFPVTDLTADAGDGYVILEWTKPATTVLSYTLSYYNEDSPDDRVEQSLDKETTTVTLDGLTNDKNYFFALTAIYEKGASEVAMAKAMPTLAIPFILDRDKAAKNQPITFTFNKEEYTTASDVTWTFPGGVVKEGFVVEHGFSTVGTQAVKLTATIGSHVRSWTLEVEIREYVVFSTDWTQDGSNYNGFKGTCPVFSPDGQTVYIVTFNKVSGLYAFDVVSGQEKWRYIPATKASSYNMLTVNPVTGDIYYGTQTEKQFYAVTPEGSLKWMFTETGSMQSASPAVNADGTMVYVCDKLGNAFGIDAQTGQKVWSFAVGEAGGGLLVNGGELVIGAGTQVIFLDAATGTEIARTALGCSMSDISGFAVSQDKRLAYFGAKNGYIGAVDLSTHTAIAPLLAGASSPNTIYEPVVAPNGTVFAGSKSGSVFCVKGDLSAVVWEHVHTGTAVANTYNYSHPCVDTENRFYITAGQKTNTTYIFSADGAVIDQYSYPGDDSAAQRQMGGNNYLGGVLYSAFIGNAKQNGIFVGTYVGGERASSWSTHGGDICGSCCVK